MKWVCQILNFSFLLQFLVFRVFGFENKVYGINYENRGVHSVQGYAYPNAIREKRKMCPNGNTNTTMCKSVTQSINIHSQNQNQGWINYKVQQPNFGWENYYLNNNQYLSGTKIQTPLIQGKKRNPKNEKQVVKHRPIHYYVDPLRPRADPVPGHAPSTHNQNPHSHQEHNEGHSNSNNGWGWGEETHEHDHHHKKKKKGKKGIFGKIIKKFKEKKAKKEKLVWKQVPECDGYDNFIKDLEVVSWKLGWLGFKKATIGLILHFLNQVYLTWSVYVIGIPERVATFLELQNEGTVPAPFKTFTEIVGIIDYLFTTFLSYPLGNLVVVVEVIAEVLTIASLALATVTIFDDVFEEKIWTFFGIDLHEVFEGYGCHNPFDKEKKIEQLFEKFHGW